MPPRRIPRQKDFPSSFFGGNWREVKTGGLREREVKAVLIETWPHLHFYQFGPPKMLITGNCV